MFTSILFIFIVFSGVAGIEVPEMVKKKHWRDLSIFLVFFTIGLSITTLRYIFQVDFSVITAWLIKVFSWWP